MINFRLLIIVSALSAVLGAMGFLRLEIDTDVLHLLPTTDKVISDGIDILERHPMHDQIAVDIMIAPGNPDMLVDIGKLLEEKMEKSGLFSQIGTDSMSGQIGDLALYIANNLPLLFSQSELDHTIAPLVSEERIAKRMAELYRNLGSIEGIGQSRFIAVDPLGLKDPILAKMALLAPTLKSKFHQGHLLSADERHLLVTARPHAAGTNTAAARDLSTFFNTASQEIVDKYAPSGLQVSITPVGAFRAALDNERIIRHDVQQALILVTLGIGVLLLFAFPRPLIGLLSLLPALAGSALALFIYSLFHQSISIMILGFGAAIISITVDHGIAYMLFLDRTHATSGTEASHEVRFIGFMAALTSICAFIILSFSGFPIFIQLGQFTSLGILCSFLFVHSAFPRVFPAMPPGSLRTLQLHTLVNKLFSTGKYGAVTAALLALVLLFFAKPYFHTSLSSMNTVSEATLAADKLFTTVWGNLGQRVTLMHSADSIAHLQRVNDTILAKMEKDMNQGVFAGAFVPSVFFPGKTRGNKNLEEWHSFWDEHRRAEVQDALRTAGARFGFTDDAFDEFSSMLDPTFQPSPKPIPPHLYNLLGISVDPKTKLFTQFISAVPGTHYSGSDFLKHYQNNSKIFDATIFTERLGHKLFTSFSVMLAVIVISVSLMLAVIYLNLTLTALTLLPPFFALICTLGTLKLLGHPIDIPALMLSIVIFGMGIDYSIFCVRAHQRYRQMNHPSYALVRVAVFMSATSTMIGFGVLCLAEHSLLKSIGLTSLLGIGYSLLGTFLLLPPLLQFTFSGRYTTSRNTKSSTLARVNKRYKMVEAYPRMFARLKLKYDPMFAELPRMLGGLQDVTTIFDIGCGYGVPACWCLEHYAQAEIIGIDPDPERIRIAALATGQRGNMTICGAEELPAISQPVDLVLLLDMLHYLNHESTTALLKNCRKTLKQNGLLVARFVVRPKSRPSWSWRLEDSRVRLSGNTPCYHSPENMANLLESAGFDVTIHEFSHYNPELFWIVGRADKEANRA